MNSWKKLPQRPENKLSHRLETRQSKRASPQNILRIFISDGFRWINDRALAVTGTVLAISMLYLLSFIQTEKIPLGITAAVVMLPALFVMIVILIFMLVSSILSPIFVLFQPIQKNNKDRLIDIINRYDSKGKILSIEIATILSWSGSLIIIGTIISFTIKFNRYFFDDNPFLGPVVIILLAPFLAHIFFCRFAVIRTLKNPRWRGLSLSFHLASFLSMLPQTLLMSYAFLIIKPTEIHHFVFGIIFSAIVLSALQLAAAKACTTLVQPTLSALNRVAVSCVGVVFLLGICPPTASWLTETMLHLTSSGSRVCTVISWGKTDVNPPSSLSSLDNPEKSTKLRIMLEADGSYLVRIPDTKSKKIYLIPRSIVAGIDDCGSEGERDLINDSSDIFKI